MTDWKSRGACQDMDTNSFFPASPSLMTRAARAACKGCPVRAECLEHALAAPEPYGIWGGTTEKERQLKKRRERRAALMETRRAAA